MAPLAAAMWSMYDLGAQHYTARRNYLGVDFEKGGKPEYVPEKNPQSQIEID